MSKHLFISDLHLDEGAPETAQAFFRFLDEVAADASSLYILGDLFEAWLGDDDRRPFNLEIIKRLRSVATAKFFMHGNRDFLIGEEFCRAAGLTLLPDPTPLEIDGTPVLLMHGDSLCTGDKQYMQARAMLRSGSFQADFLARSLAERAAIAVQARGESEAHKRQTADDIMDVTPEEVTSVMAAHGITTLIHGHTHRPATHALEIDGKSATRYVLGDWHGGAWFLAMQDGRPELLRYEFP